METMTLPIPTETSARPWADWPEPTIMPTRLHELWADVEDFGQEERDWRVLLKSGESLCGEATPAALHSLGKQTQFPVDFLLKLDPQVRAAVINDRMKKVYDRDLSVILEGERITQIVPGWRGIAPYKEVADIAFSTLEKVYRDVEIADQRLDDAGISLRLMTPVQEPVTRKVGDILQMGVDIRHSYATAVSVSLYTKRLVCLNGMMQGENTFKWEQKATGTVEHQLSWLACAVEECLSRYENLVGRAREMAETRFSGDPQSVLREHARAMRFPSERLPALIEAFEAEPGDTAWDLLNAFTRVATHGGLPASTARNVLHAAGQWASEFEMVTARLPRPVAISAGAEILS